MQIQQHWIEQWKEGLNIEMQIYANILHEKMLILLLMSLASLIFPELSYRIIGILFEVHTSLGNRYQEKYYQRAVAIKLKKNNISFKKEIPIDLIIDKEKIGKYFLDF